MNRVLVLLSTYNGEKYLDEQLKSIFNQKNVKVSVLARDDGSNDSTTKILEKWKQTHDLNWYTGNNVKPAKSFLNLIKNAKGYDYYALCDQDDYWCNEKLSVATNLLESSSADLYYSATTLVDEKLNRIKQIDYPQHDYTLYQSIMYNNISGCTMVFGENLKKAINIYEPQYLAMHDWWIILLCKALKMKTVYDSESHILYRQHGDNTVGLKQGSVVKYWMHCAFRKDKKMSTMLNEIINGYYTYLKEDIIKDLRLVTNSNNSIKNRVKLLTDKRFCIESVHHMKKETIGFKIRVIFRNV
mgnify:CR=1 FL=1